MPSRSTFWPSSRSRRAKTKKRACAVPRGRGPPTRVPPAGCRILAATFRELSPGSRRQPPARPPGLKQSQNSTQVRLGLSNASAAPPALILYTPSASCRLKRRRRQQWRLVLVPRVPSCCAQAAKFPARRIPRPLPRSLWRVPPGALRQTTNPTHSLNPVGTFSCRIFLTSPTSASGSRRSPRPTPAAREHGNAAAPGTVDSPAPPRLTTRRWLWKAQTPSQEPRPRRPSPHQGKQRCKKVVGQRRPSPHQDRKRGIGVGLSQRWRDSIRGIWSHRLSKTSPTWSRAAATNRASPAPTRMSWYPATALDSLLATWW